MLCERIKDLRIANNYSQVDLARLLGVTKQSISNWENNNIMPSVEMLVKIAELFSVSTDYILGLDDKKYIMVEGLTEEEISHVRLIIKDITK